MFSNFPLKFPRRDTQICRRNVGWRDHIGRSRSTAGALKNSSAHFNSASFDESGAGLKIRTEIRLRGRARAYAGIRRSAFRRMDVESDAHAHVVLKRLEENVGKRRQRAECKRVIDQAENFRMGSVALCGAECRPFPHICHQRMPGDEGPVLHRQI